MKSLLFLLITTSAFAELNYSVGDWSSGGGNVVVCFHSSDSDLVKEIKSRPNREILQQEYARVYSVKMYDLYEAEMFNGDTIIPIKDGEDELSYLERIEKPFREHIWGLKNIFDEATEQLKDSDFVFHNGGIKFQDDLNEVVLLPENCLIKTMGAQVTEGGFSRAYVDSTLYHHPGHSLLSRSVFRLHERLYAYGRTYLNHKKSGKTRILISHLITKPKDRTIGKVVDVLARLGYWGKSESSPLYFTNLYKELTSLHARAWNFFFREEYQILSSDYELYQRVKSLKKEICDKVRSCESTNTDENEDDADISLLEMNDSLVGIYSVFFSNENNQQSELYIEYLDIERKLGELFFSRNNWFRDSMNNKLFEGIDYWSVKYYEKEPKKKEIFVNFLRELYGELTLNLSRSYSYSICGEGFKSSMEYIDSSLNLNDLPSNTSSCRYNGFLKRIMTSLRGSVIIVDVHGKPTSYTLDMKDIQI